MISEGPWLFSHQYMEAASQCITVAILSLEKYMKGDTETERERDAIYYIGCLINGVYQAAERERGDDLNREMQRRGRYSIG